MLPGGTDALYRQVLATPHRHYARIEVWSGLGVQLAVPEQFTGSPEGGLVYLNGAVTATLNSRVTRNLYLTLPGGLYSADADGLLAPFGNELRVFRGVTLGDGSDIYTWEIFRGRIRRQSKNSQGLLTIQASDRAADVTDNQFVTPQNSQTINTVALEWQRLIIDAFPLATFGTSDSFTAMVKPLSWELSRAAALDEMVSSVGGIWYALANGEFVIRKNPFATPKPSVVTLTDVDGGTVNDWECFIDRSNIYNVVTVTGERLNGDGPVYATASDIDSSSPTYISGGFGVRSLLERRQTPSTPGGAQGAANAILSASVAPVEAWTLGMVPDAALELGDVVTLQLDSREVKQVVSGFRIPVGNEGEMMVSTSSLVSNRLEVS